MSIPGITKTKLGLALALTMCAWSALAKTGGDGVARADSNADIYGRWKIAKILDYADITALSESGARKLIGTTVVVAKHKLVVGTEACQDPGYERSVEDTATTMREKGHVSSANMGLPEQVTVVDAGCTDIFLKGKNRIVVHWRGFYFDAVKQKR